MDGKEMSAAFKLYKREHPSHFADTVGGRYLANRMEAAFLAGIVAAEVAARAASPSGVLRTDGGNG